MFLLRSITLSVLIAASAAVAQAQEKFTFMTNWLAQAEQGGFYQALVSGLYKKEGLDLTLRMGGPQVNGIQLLAAGQIDCYMGYDVSVMKTWENGIQAVTVAASFQKDPQVLIGHPGVTNRMEDLVGKTILISTGSQNSFWPWLKATYKLQDSQVRPYTFNIQPFVADKNVVQQGFMTSEPYAIEQVAKFKPSVFLLADYGWPPYSTTIVCMEKTIKQRPKAVAAFVKASMEGWKAYLGGDPSAANSAIKKDNPAMTDELLAHSIRLLKEAGIVTGGDAATQGIGVITDERMKKTYEMLVSMKLIDPAKVPLARTYSTEFVRNLRVMP
jgi:NitT/TauT family transport system substrate-binding protein